LHREPRNFVNILWTDRAPARHRNQFFIIRAFDASTVREKSPRPAPGEFCSMRLLY
jgi:hypothetical protein